MTAVRNLKVWTALVLGVAVAATGAAMVMALLVGTKPADAAFPGTNGKIAFESNRNGNVEIYRMNSNGTSQQNLTSSFFSDFHPEYSANGKQIVFISSRDAEDGRFSSEIYRMSPTGTFQTRLTKNGTGERYPAWSPSGTKIAFVGYHNSSSQIYTMKADGTGQKRLTTNDNNEEIDSLAWSPDGTKIAFDMAQSFSNPQIFVMNPDGTGLRNLSKNSAYDAQPEWSPNSQKIAFTSTRNNMSTTPTSEIFVMNRDGTRIIPLTNNEVSEWEPVYSPNGSQIAFTSSRTTVGNPTGDAEIYRMSASGGAQTQLTSNTGVEDTYPSWQSLP